MQEYVIDAVGKTAAIEVGASNSLALTLRGGTVNAVGVGLVFEVSLDSTNGIDGTWHQIIGARVTANTAEGGYTGAVNAGATAGIGWRFNVANYSWFRVRCNALTSGNLRALAAAGPEGIDPVPVLMPTANPSPSGTSHKVVSAATTNLALLRGAGSDINDVTVSNPTGTAAFVKLYDLARAPLVTDVPELTIPVPAGGFISQAFGYLGKRFANGLGIGITGAAPANDATAAPVGVVVHITRGA